MPSLRLAVPRAEPKSLAREPRTVSKLLSGRVSWDTHPLHGHSTIPARRNEAGGRAPAAASAVCRLQPRPSRLPAAPLHAGKVLGKGERRGGCCIRALLPRGPWGCLGDSVSALPSEDRLAPYLALFHPFPPFPALQRRWIKSSLFRLQLIRPRRLQRHERAVAVVGHEGSRQGSLAGSFWLFLACPPCFAPTCRFPGWVGAFFQPGSCRDDGNWGSQWKSCGGS